MIVFNWNQAAVNPILELSVNYFFHGLERIEQVCPVCCIASATAFSQMYIFHILNQTKDDLPTFSKHF